MNSVQGALRKMRTRAGECVEYTLPVGDALVEINPLLGQTIRLDFSGRIFCVACGRQTNRSFNRGYCYPCFQALAQCDLCIIKPELCHYDRGTCREPAWGETHCMQPHAVYLANSSGVKVGITRRTQIPTRWMDQGATQALPIARVPSRHRAGLVEVLLKRHVSDRTDWRRMLKGEPEPVDLAARREALFAAGGSELAALLEDTHECSPPTAADEHRFTYPVLEYPAKVRALNLDKTPTLEGQLSGIKGQYLLLDAGVLNVRKFGGYEVRFQA